MVRLFCSLLAAGFLYLLPNSLQAQVPGVCAERGVVVERLGVRYSEQPVSIGLAADGSVIEVFASTSGTFTIVATQPSGVSCILVTGESWEGLPATKAGPKNLIAATVSKGP